MNSIADLFDSAPPLVTEADEFSPSYECDEDESDLRCERCGGSCRKHYDVDGAQLCLECAREIGRQQYVSDEAQEQLGDLEREDW